MENSVMVAVEVKQVATITVTDGASGSKQQQLRCSRSWQRIVVAAMAWAQLRRWLLAAASRTFIFDLLAAAVWHLIISDLWSRALCVWLCKVYEWVSVCVCRFFHLDFRFVSLFVCLWLCFIDNFFILKLTRSIFRIWLDETHPIRLAEKHPIGFC